MPLTVTFDLEDSRSSADSGAAVRRDESPLPRLPARAWDQGNLVRRRRARARPARSSCGGWRRTVTSSACTVCATSPSPGVGPGRLRAGARAGARAARRTPAACRCAGSAHRSSPSPRRPPGPSRRSPRRDSPTPRASCRAQPPARLAGRSAAALPLAQRPARAPVSGGGRGKAPGSVPRRHLPALLPARAVTAAGARGRRRGHPWSYVHPYDIDPDEPFFVMPHAGWLVSRIVHTRRGATLGTARRDARRPRGGRAGRWVRSPPSSSAPTCRVMDPGA